MKLADHTTLIRESIERAITNKLGRMGISPAGAQPIAQILEEFKKDRRRIDEIRDVFFKETGTVALAFEKLVDEFTFTLFNRIAALKVMEAHVLIPEVVTKRNQYGDHSFSHFAWLESNPEGRYQDADGILSFFESQFEEIGKDIPLFSLDHPYHLMPTALELQEIVLNFNRVEEDTQVETEVWKSDDVLGWLYESYNNHKKAKHKEDGGKTEYNKVSIQSQVYTPKWVVKFLVDNSLGKLYLEMYPESEIRNKYSIANAPTQSTRSIKPLHEIKLIDPSNGSGNFLLYSFDVFYDLYVDQIDNYGADYEIKDIPKWIIEHNLHGVDLDDRAIQLAQLGLLIKAKRKRKTVRIDYFNVVSSDFFLPDFEDVAHLFESDGDVKLPERHQKIIEDLWADLQNAYKFGSLIRLEEKMSLRWFGTKAKNDESQVMLFGDENLESFDKFKDQFFANLKMAMAQNSARQGYSFLNSQAQEAITFLKILTQKYDIAVANPPYTDSADFGPELKEFIDSNYKLPFKFNANLYASFIKRCYELIEERGKMALIHPPSFMYISSFEDVRRFILEKLHIDLFIEFDFGGIFTSKVDVDIAGYIFEKEKKPEAQSFFMNLQDYKGLKIKRTIFEDAFADFLNGRQNKHNYIIDQEVLKSIKGFPFIYWISMSFRNKFSKESLIDKFSIAQGLATANNDRFIRHWWEVLFNSSDLLHSNNKWFNYSKGGPFNKWFGNNWAVVNWAKNGEEIRNIKDENGKIRSRAQNEKFYFKEGITYSASGQKGATFRIHPCNSLFDVGGSCIFPTKEFKNLNYALAFLNSKLCFYILNCLNPTVNTQVGDMNRIPFVKPPQVLEDNISALATENVAIKKQLNSFKIIETNYNQNPILAYSDAALKDRLLTYLNYENAQMTLVLLNEAVIDQLIFKVYDLSEEDRLLVETKMDKSVCQLAIGIDELRMFNKAIEDWKLPFNSIVQGHMRNLTVREIDEEKKLQIISEFPSLYQSNCNLEEFCIRHQVNPINVWCWFKESRLLPQARSNEIALEFLADAFRTILIEDEDGIVPLVGLPGEPCLMDRFEEYCFRKGFTSAQIMQLDAFLNRPINVYLEHYFFNDFSNLLNLFRHLPKTPFIWHLSSGEHQGFEVYILIYKWNRDSLFKLKSQYISQRIQNLEYRQIQLQDVSTAQAQNEKEKIRNQLQEIEVFKTKIDELISENYDPKLDDGVGKNIAPLQKKGLLRAEVLKTTGGAKSQLEKYLNADW